MANTAWIKKFDVEQKLKNKGIEIQIDSDGKQLGDMVISKTGMTWCEGKTSKNVTKFTFDELNWIAWYKDEVMTAVKAARKRDKA